MKIQAYAKINLTLEVLGMRPDGYHDLRSVVQPVTLADEIDIEPTDGGTIRVETISDGSVPIEALSGPAENNLAWKAADALRKATGVRKGAAIRILKKIPLGGGLGGGSADAAATLNALNGLWGTGLAKEELAEIGATVGSDVPALVIGGTVLMEGRGERVSRWPGGAGGPPAPKRHFLLANPGVHASTPAVFRACPISRLTGDKEILDNMRLAFSGGGAEAFAAAMQNDLADAAYALYPQIAEARRALLEAGALNATLTGSGATVAGVVRDASHGEEARRKVSRLMWCALAENCPVV